MLGSIEGRSLIHNSTSVRWASKSSTVRNCRRYSDIGKIQDGRSSSDRHRTNSLERSPECRRLRLWGRKLARCCWAVDDSRAGSRSHASGRCAACEQGRRTQGLAAATTELPLMRRMCGTLFKDTRSAAQMRPTRSPVIGARLGSTPPALCPLFTELLMSRCVSQSFERCQGGHRQRSNQMRKYASSRSSC
jgi:hypothetical protein